MKNFTGDVISSLLFAGMMAAGPAPAATTLVDGVTSNHPGNFSLPGGDTLIVTNNGVLNVGDQAFLGDGGDGSYTIVSGTNSEMRTADGFVVGKNGAHNVLVVSDGGYLLNEYTTTGSSWGHWDLIGDGGNSNRVLITGEGSMWDHADNRFYIGYNGGAYNTVTVSNGGTLRLTRDLSIIGHEGDGHNEIVITDGGLFHWTESATHVYFNHSSDDNVFRVVNGGIVSNDSTASTSFRMGGSGGGIRGRLIVDGSNSVFHWGGDILVGSAGDGRHAVVVTNQAQLTSGLFRLGSAAGCGSNTAHISGQSAASVGNIILGGAADSSYNEMLVDGGSRIENSGYIRIGNATNTDHNVLLVSGSGTYVGNSSALDIGDSHHGSASGTGNRMQLDSGATVRIGGQVTIDTTSEGQISTLLVTGEGTAMTGAARIVVGEYGYGTSELRVEDQALLEVEGELVTARYGSRNDRIVVDNAVMVLHNNFWARNSPQATILVTNGGIIRALDTSSTVELGALSSGHSNTMIVTGSGSLLTNAGSMYVGNQGAYNKLMVEDNGLVQVDGGIYVGGSGASTGNELLISNGGRVTVTTNLLRLGDSALLNSNRVVVSGQDSILELLDTGGRQRFGTSGSYNETLIEAGGKIDVRGERTQLGDSGQYNRFVVDGEGSAHYGRRLYMANSGQHNLLLVTNGGLFELSGNASIGYGATSQSNLVLVTGADSVFRSTTYRLSLMGSYNLTRIEDGGRLESSSAQIGAGQNGGGLTNTGAWNYAEVSGEGSAWINTGDFKVGEDASHNTLVVTNAGRVHTDGALYIGETSVAHSNRVIVAGEATGFSGGGLEIGGDAGSGHNIMTVTGPGSSWTNTGTIFISAGEGEGNRLEIRDDAIVDSDDTVVRAGGTLLLDAAYLDSNLTIEDGGALEGNGIIQGFSVVSGGRIAPGQSAGDLEIWGNLTLQETSLLEMELGGTDAGEYDRLVGAGFSIAFAGTFSVALLGGYDPQDGDTFVLFDNWDLAGSSGSFAEYDLPALGAGLGWDRSELESEGTLTVIPEPATLLLLLPALLYIRRRRTA